MRLFNGNKQISLSIYELKENSNLAKFTTHIDNRKTLPI